MEIIYFGLDHCVAEPINAIKKNPMGPNALEKRPFLPFIVSSQYKIRVRGFTENRHTTS